MNRDSFDQERSQTPLTVDLPAPYDYVTLTYFLTNRNLKRWFVGLLSARIGDWIYTVALNWTVLCLTESTFYLALINFCRLAPTLMLTVPAGFLADRFDRRRLLASIYSGVAVLSLLVGLTLLYSSPFWVCAFAVVAHACLMAAERPVRNALLSELEPNNLSQAVAKNACVMNLGLILGTICGGFLVARLPLMACFGLVALGAAIYALCLGSMKMAPSVTKAPSTQDGSHLSEAWEFLKSQPQVFYLMALGVAPMMFGFPYIGMLPLFTRELMGLGAEGFGSLLSVSAVGALTATHVLSSNPGRFCRGPVMAAGLFFFSGGLMLLTIAPGAFSAAVLLFGIGFASQWYRTASRVLLQASIPRELQGRIVSLALLDRSLIPLGALIIGGLASAFGPMVGALSMGLGCGLGSLAVLSLFPQLWSMRIQGAKPQKAPNKQSVFAGKPVKVAG